MSKWNFAPSLRQQILFALVLTAALPSIAITQGLIGLSRHFIEGQLQQVDRECLLDLGQLQQEVDRKQSQVAASANHLSTLMEELNINLKDSTLGQTNRDFIDRFLEKELLQSSSSFVLITDRSGRTVAQQIRMVAMDRGVYPAVLPAGDQKATVVGYQPVNQPTNIDFSTLAIVQNAMVRRQAFSGVELVNSRLLARMGLSAQASVGIRPQKTAGLSQPSKPAPEGTYDTEQGQVGMVLMAVQPIERQGQMVGTAIVGYLVNRNPELVDRIRHKTGVPTVTLFAKDLRVSTNVPYSDGRTRAIGTRVSAEVSHTVLDKGQYFLGRTNIIGSNYRTAYRPLYDHTHQLDRRSKPVGIAYVGQSLDEFEAYLQQLLFGGYAIGGVAILLAVLASIRISRNLTQPVQQIVQFAEAISKTNLNYRISGSYSAEMQDLVSALERLRTSLQMSFRLVAKTYYEQGYKLYEQGEFDAARKALEQAIVLLPKENDFLTLEVQALLDKLPQSQQGN